MPILNRYQTVPSKTGKQVTVVTDYTLGPDDNPWKIINEAGRKYRRGKNGEFEIMQLNQGDWDIVNPVDEEYWTDYVADIEKKLKETQEYRLPSFIWKRLTGNNEKQKHGGRLMRVGGKIIEIPRD